MDTIQTCEFRLYPNQAQIGQLQIQFGHTWRVYNYLLAQIKACDPSADFVPDYRDLTRLPKDNLIMADQILDAPHLFIEEATGG